MLFSYVAFPWPARISGVILRKKIKGKKTKKNQKKRKKKTIKKPKRFIFVDKGLLQNENTRHMGAAGSGWDERNELF